MREGYKMTELGEIPEDWKISNLESHSYFITKGSTPTTYGFEWQEFGIRFLRSECVSPDGFILSGAMHISEKANEAMERSKIKGGDILMTITGNVGRVCIYPTEYEKGNINQHIARIRIDDSMVSPQFVFQYLSQASIIEEYLKITTGQAYPQLSLKQVRETKIPLPSIEEQQKIATILSTVDEKIEVIDAQITQTRDLKKGLMQKLLTRGIGHTKFKDSVLGEIPESWEVVKLGRLVFKVGSGITPKGGYESYVASGVTFIRSQNVLINRLNLTDVAYISSVQHDKMNNSKVQPKDVLLNITGASIGRSCVVPDYLKEANVNQHVCIIRTNKELNPLFLTQLLNSEQGSKQIDKFQAGGNREGLNFQQIKSFDIPLPSPSEQKRIVDMLSTVDGKVSILERKKETYQQLKKGLMQQLLTGKVRVMQSELQNA